MRKFFAIISLALLAACGGGGGTTAPLPSVAPSVAPSPTIKPSPSATPASIEYAWQGSLAPGGSTQTFARVHKMTTGASPTPIPVQATLCDPRSADCRAGDQQQYFGLDTNPTVDITDPATPAPTAAPSVSPPPGLAVALQHSNSPTFTYRVDTPTQAGCGDTDVAFSNAHGKIHVCAYPVFTIGCVPALSMQPGGGYDTSVAAGYSFDTNSYVTDPSQADVYITGQTCPGTFYATNSGPNDYEVYFPYGATALASASTTLATTDPTLWANTMTQFEINQNAYPSQPCGNALTCLVLLKTHAGNIVEFLITRSGADGPNDPIYHGDWFTAAYSVASGGAFMK